MGAIARIIARYGIGYLAAKGLPLEGLSDDPDVVAVIELIVTGLSAAAIEGWYWLARKYGWSR